MKRNVYLNCVLGFVLGLLVNADAFTVNFNIYTDGDVFPESSMTPATGSVSSNLQFRVTTEFLAERLKASRTGYHVDRWMFTRKNFREGDVLTWGNTGDFYYLADGEDLAQDEDYLIPSSSGTYTLLAHCVPNEYNVSLNWGSWTTKVDTVTATYERPMPQIAVPARLGYVFKGYSLGGTKYYNADGTSAHIWDRAHEDLVLQAEWEPRVYVITLDNQGATTPGAEQVTATYGQSLPSITANLPKRTGFTFGGYYTDVNGNGVQWISANGAPISLGWVQDGDATFYALWTANTYKVIYQPNGASGSAREEEIRFASDWTTYGGNVFTRKGYTCTGWNTTATGTGVHYDLEEVSQWQTAGNLTLFAEWRPNAYRVVFNVNGGSGEAMDPINATYDASCQLPFNTYVKEGYYFGGWALTAEGAVVYGDGAWILNLTDQDDVDVQLYATWGAGNYRIKYLPEGGVGTMEDQTAQIDQGVKLTANGFERDGWLFAGWATNEPYTAENVSLADGVVVTNLTRIADAVVELHAAWTGRTYRVVLDARDDRGNGYLTNGLGMCVSVLTNDVVVGDAWNLPQPTNESSHLAFGGWVYRTEDGKLVPIPETVPPESVGATNLCVSWTWQTDPLAAAVDAPELEFRTGFAGGDAESCSGWLVDAASAGGSSTNSAKSGRLPTAPPIADAGGDFKTWMATVIPARSVVTFQWRLSSRKQISYEGKVSGNEMRFLVEENSLTSISAGCEEDEGQFGRGDENNPLVDLGWRSVSYTNESENVVEVKWEFLFQTDGWYRNGGGTGWVDRVVCSSLDAEDSVTATHQVPYAWLKETFPELSGADADAFEQMAERQSGQTGTKVWPDGRPYRVWEDYVTGTSPFDDADVFQARIEMKDGVPCVTCVPEMGQGGATEDCYQIDGKIELNDEWTSNVTPSKGSPHRFFRVKIVWPK